MTDLATPREPHAGAIGVATSPRVAGWLRAARDGPVAVLHQCPEIVHLDLSGRCLSIAAAGAPGLPTALRTNLRSVSSRSVASAYLGDGTLHWGGRVLVLRRLVDVRAPRLDRGVLKASPAAVQGTPRSRVAGLVALPSALTGDTVPDFIGYGDGLTPLGDDVVVGWLAVHRAVGAPTPAVDHAVRRLLSRTTTLSATLLDCALAGEVADPLRDHVAAIGTDHEPASRSALASFGGSSGLGLLHGVDLARVALTTAAAA